MKQLIPFLLLLVTATSAPVSAEDFSIVTIDMSRILNESPLGKEKRKELDLISAAAQKKVEDRRSKIAILEKKVKESKAKEGSAEFERLRDSAKEFGRFIKDTEEEVKKEHMKFTKELLTLSYTTVKKYAEEKKIDLVLDKSEKSRGPVLFGSQSMDITDDILARMKKS